MGQIGVIYGQACCGRRRPPYIEGMDNGYQITLTRDGDQTYSWQPRSKLPRLLLAVLGLALLAALATFAIGAIVVSVLVAMVLVVTAMIRRPVRRWLDRRRGRARPF